MTFIPFCEPTGTRAEDASGRTYTKREDGRFDVARPDGSSDVYNAPFVNDLVRRGVAFSVIRPCTCECATGGSCGGCGHAGCLGRRR